MLLPDSPGPPRRGQAAGMARPARHGRRAVLLSLLALPVAATAAETDALRAALGEMLRGRLAEEGGIEISAPRLAENGQQVPITIRVPEAEARAIHLFAPANPTPGVATFRFHPGIARAEVQTRIRLAEGQRVLVLAELADGSLRQAAVEIAVTTGGCLA